MMRALLGLMLMVLIFAVWRTSLQKVHQWNRTKHDTELFVPPGEPPSLLRSQQGEGNTPNGPGQAAVTIEIKAVSYDDDDAPVDTQLKLRRDGKFEIKLPTAWDLEESKEVVYRIQDRIRTLITTPDGEILNREENEKNGWFYHHNSRMLGIFSTRPIAGASSAGSDTGVPPRTWTVPRSVCDIRDDPSGDRYFTFDSADFLNGIVLRSLDPDEARDYTLSFGMWEGDGFGSRSLRTVNEIHFEDLSEILEPSMKSGIIER